MYLTAVQLQEAVPLDSTARRQALVYQAEATDLTRYATMLVGPDDAGDVVTESFLRLFRNPTWQAHQIHDEGRFLRTVARSVAADRYRSGKRRRARERLAWLANQASEHYDDAVEAVDNADLLHRILAELSPQQAEVVRLYALGHRVVEIADELGIKDGTVRRYLTRSERTIRRILQANREDEQR